MSKKGALMKSETFGELAEAEVIRTGVKSDTDAEGNVRCRKCGRVVESGEYSMSLMGRGVKCNRAECADPWEKPFRSNPTVADRREQSE